RLVQMFGSVVMGIADEPFEDYLTEVKQQRGVKTDVELDAAAWKAVTREFQAIFQHETQKPFPQDAYEQLSLSVEAVFKSWNGKRAVDYRRAAHIPDDLGTGVNVQM